MPNLKSVIDSFNSGFCYLDPATNLRKTRWFEFWMACESLKEEYTNTLLTQDLEGVARKVTQQLECLSKTKGTDDFEIAQQDFKNIIAAAIQQAQIKRFKNGTLTTESTVSSDGASFMTRTIVPKNAGTFEKNLMGGLEAIAQLYPELSALMTEMREKITITRASAVLVFESKTRGTGKLSMFSDRNLTTIASNYHLLSEREKYAAETIPSVKF